MSGPEAVVYAVLAVRLLVPLGIPRYPLPCILAALVIDAGDQTLFQTVGVGNDVAGYQSYDKALDVYYLTIAYVSTLRNWIDPVALSVARFLFYYRIVGVVAFELTGARALLLIFPNTFEYFFIFYEAVRLYWNPSRLQRAQLVGAAAAIWIFVKLPQEWWIHIAQLDFTEQLAHHGWLGPTLVVVGAALALVLRRAARRLLPRPERRPSFDADRHVRRPHGAAVVPRTDVRAVFSVAVLEKAALLAMVAVIFSQVLPDTRATELELAISVALVVAINAAVSLARVRRGTRWASTLIQFLSMLSINVGAVVVLDLLSPRADAAIPLGSTLFYLALISLIITLYDRYRVIGNVSREEVRRRAPAAPQGA